MPLASTSVKGSSSDESDVDGSPWRLFGSLYKVDWRNVSLPRHPKVILIRDDGD